MHLSLKRLLAVSAMAVMATLAHASDPVLSRDAPQDKPAVISSALRYQRAIAPLVARARASYPQAKQRFLAGLPAGQTFFLTTELMDARGNTEQVFIAVSSIENGKVTGRIWNDLMHVTGYRRGQTYSFSETVLIDWLITKPDGSEEGNVVGKFLDTYKGD